MRAKSRLPASRNDLIFGGFDQAGGDLMFASSAEGVYRTSSALVLAMMRDMDWKLSSAPEPAGSAMGALAMRTRRTRPGLNETPAPSAAQAMLIPA